ncbi:TniQ family protein [Salinispora arenicola]|uniref:TniQ family protein n=1 Tax=Salinispora arenicola TaxID=168697 RepID=UPI0003815675|nr:TniQ family protein [Salinispora arenicola]
MKTWQQTAQRLPVRVRPMRGETVISYVFRLADANDLARPTILLGALGRPTRGLTRSLVNDFDIRVNQHSLDRLETFTGIPAARLRKALPGLHRLDDTLPEEIPAFRPSRAWGLHDYCDQCAARLPAQHTIRVYSLYFPKLCRKHRVWFADRTDLTNTPEIITAHRRYGRLLAATGDRQWAYGQLHRATQIIMDWAPHSYRLVPRLHERWEARGKALPGFHTPHNPTHLLVYPEAVALTEVFCDLEWRRHIAMVREFQTANFYQHVAKRLNQPPDFARWLERPWTRLLRRNYESVPNPIQRWINEIRHKHAKTRTEFYERHAGFARTPFPEIRHFK